MRASLISLALIGASNASALSAQAPTYRRMPGDTLRYVWTMQGTTEVQGGPTGGMEMRVRSEMKMVLAFFPSDTMRMWTESVSMVLTTPQGEMTPPVGGILNKQIVYRMHPNGRLELLAMPDLGAELNQFAGSIPQTNTMLMTLPKEALRVGLEWTDTINSATGSPGDNQSTVKAISRYRVARDTVLDGERVFAIDVQSSNQTEMVTAMPAMNMGSHLNSSGTEAGAVFFSPQRGAIVRRTSTITMESVTQMSGANNMSMTMRGRLEGTLTLVR